jgi:AraC-like DNA-binding protein
MKVLPFKIPKPKNDALVYQQDKGVTFYDKLHQHEEIQLSSIIEGSGTLIVGDTINYYKQGDILIIGSNLPHVFKSDTTAISSHMQSLFFTKTSFGESFFELEELQELNLFFKRSTHGYKLTSSKKAISNLFLELHQASKFNQFIIFLKILKITSTANYKSLSSFINEKKYNDNEGKRMRDVFEYTMSNYDCEISLDDISEIATMTRNAFCKYFKKRTNKTYFQFLNELRIENACKLIKTEKDLSVSEIAYKSGFKNISNFNRQFKSLKKISPTAFRNT